MSKKTNVGIVIVNWNTGRLLGRCLTSLEALSDKDRISEIVVVDNASTDNSFMSIKKQSWDIPVHFRQLDFNAGFARANNVGIEFIHSTGKDPHILLLNPDTIVHDRALSKMIDTLEQTSKTAVVGPRLLNEDGSVQYSIRRFPTLRVLALLLLKLGRLKSIPSMKHYLWHDFDYKKQQDVDQIMGAAFLIRNTALDTIGLLDERYWLWFEEVDYCMRVHAADKRVVYTPDPTITHVGGASFHQRIGIQKMIPFAASAVRYAYRHMSALAAALLVALYPVALLLALPAGVVHFSQKQKNAARL